MKKVIMFDMDGVLVDTEKYYNIFWRQAALEYGHQMSVEQAYLLRSLSGNLAEPLLKSMFGEAFDYTAVRNRRKELMKEFFSEHKPEMKTGVMEALEYLKEAGYKIALVTSSDSENAASQLKSLNIYDYFEFIISAAMVKNGKPDPDAYLYACEQLQELPEHCIAVEDSPNGVISAYKAGCKVIMVPDLTQPEEELTSMIFVKLNSLMLLPETLKVLEKQH